MKKSIGRITLLFCIVGIWQAYAQEKPDIVATFSIVARDSATGELGVAVASRFFSVGTVVPWAKADVGAVATQSFANTSFGWKGLKLMGSGLTPQEALKVMLRNDDNPDKRQVGLVSEDGQSATYTGEGCVSWAGGRNGPNYAVQGNILTGESVVIEMEKTFLDSKGSLASRLYAALMAGQKQGGDSRGKQSAALLVVRDKAGYGGYTDRAVDIRVDDHAEPFKELGRLLKIAEMNDAWNQGWTLFTQKKFEAAIPPIERAAKLAPDYPEVLYDLAVIRLAAGQEAGAFKALKKALQLNPKLKAQAAKDDDLASLRESTEFKNLIK